MKKDTVAYSFAHKLAFKCLFWLPREYLSRVLASNRALTHKFQKTPKLPNLELFLFAFSVFFIEHINLKKRSRTLDRYQNEQLKLHNSLTALFT